MRRVMLERIEEEEERRNRVRPLEDPYLVGEEAAARARAERMARESVRGGGDEILIREDRRWDWFLGESSSSSYFCLSRHSSYFFRSRGARGGGIGG
jgi:hypothetical protein